MSRTHTGRPITSHSQLKAALRRKSQDVPVVAPVPPVQQSNVPPWAHYGFLGARNLQPDRMPSAKRERTTTLKLVEVNSSSLKTLQDIAPSLKRLDLTALKLRVLTDAMLSGCICLQKLDISNNDITAEGIPECIANLELLIEFAAHYNNFHHIPAAIAKLKNLSRLKLSYNKLDSLLGVEKLKRLKTLVVDCNQISTIHKELYQSLRKLEVLHCAGNHIQLILSDIRHMKHLTDIDLANNQLQTLPPEIFLLPCLENLNASGNQIIRVPTLNVKTHTEHSIETIDLSDNALIKFPGYLLYMVEKLDLSQNRIKAIPGSIIHKLNWNTHKEVLLDDNPIASPPREVWESGLRGLITYFNEETVVSKVYQGVKVLVLGSYKCGKTSLVESFVDQQSRVVEDSARTLGANIFDHTIEIEGASDRPPRPFDLSIWDLGGHPSYRFPHYFFMLQPALVLLVFNIKEYSKRNFYNAIGYWIDWMIAKNNKVVFIPVGTHSDQLTMKENERISTEVHREIQQFLVTHKSQIEDEVKKIESRSIIPPALQEQLKHYMSLMRVEKEIYPEVVPISAKDYSGFDRLQEAILAMSMDKKFFPSVMRVIPSLWLDVQNYVEDKGNIMKVPLLKWEDYVNDVSSKHGMKHLIGYITTYLHECGKVVWFSTHETLKDYVFLRPSWLTDLFKMLFRHDMESLDFLQNETFHTSGMNQSKFDMSKKEYLVDGTTDKDFLKALLAGLIPPEVNTPLHEVLGILTQYFEIGYPMDRRYLKESGRQSALSTVSDKSRKSSESRKSVKPPKVARVHRVMIPWFRTRPEPASVEETLGRLKTNPGLVNAYRFPRFLPPGFVERCIARASNHKHNLNITNVWKGGIFGRHFEKPVRVLMRVAKKSKNIHILFVEVRYESRVEEHDVSEMWKVMLPLLQDIEGLLAQFPGK